MSLTTRQISMMAYLVNRPDWVTSDQMSVHFHMNRKTVQREMREIQDYFGKDIVLNMNPRRGYRLEQISPAAQSELIQTTEFYGGVKNCLLPRPSTLVLYLLFLSDYISMQELADTFFYSKTVIAVEMENVRRWCERQANLTLEISRTKGLRIYASEYRKRIFFINFGSRAAFQSLPFDEEIKKNYESMLLLTRDVLQRLVIRKGFLISGESLLKTTRFIAASILRDRMGYLLTGSIPDYPENPVVAEFAHVMRDEYGISLSSLECRSISLLFDDCDRLPSGYSAQEIQPTLDRGLQRFERSICALLQQPEKTIFKDRGSMASCLSAMLKRDANQDTAVNHYNEDIVVMEPLAVHLTHRFLKDCFGLPINKETSFLSLFVADALKELQKELQEKPALLLISNQNIAIIEQIRNALRRECTVSLGPIHAVPVYYMEVHPEIAEQYRFILTTQQECILQHPEYYLIPPLPTSSVVKEFDFFLQENLRDGQLSAQQMLRDRCFRKISFTEHCPSLEQLLGLPDDGTFTYHLFGNGNLHVARVCSQASTMLHVFELKYPLAFRMKSVQRVIFSSLRPGDADAFLFYQTVSELLKEYS